MWHDVWSLLDSGGPVMWALLLNALALWFALGYRLVILRRGTSQSVLALLAHLQRGECPRGGGLVTEAAERALEVMRRHPRHPRHQLEDALADLERLAMRHRRLVLVLAGTAPLLGLLGTVMGMIETFDSLADQALYTRDGGIASGISQALITTQMGLAVAIPALLLGAFLDRRQRRIHHELAQIKELACSGRLSG